MSGEEAVRVSGVAVGSGVRVTDERGIEALASRGYGERERGALRLAAHEALYLVHHGQLSVSGRRGRNVAFGEIMRKFRAERDDALLRFLIYRDLRARGYVVRDGFGFGADYCVYARGEYGKKGARYLVFGFADGRGETVGSLERKVCEITAMGKEPIVAVVDGRGEVIYYKIAPASFSQNDARVT